jgi:hypothetical protein
MKKSPVLHNIADFERWSCFLGEQRPIYHYRHEIGTSIIAGNEYTDAVLDAYENCKKRSGEPVFPAIAILSWCGKAQGWLEFNIIFIAKSDFESESDRIL